MKKEIAKARAYANIAIAKYWGKRDESVNLPIFDSLAFNVADLYSETTARWVDEGEDSLTIDNWSVPPSLMGRTLRILDAIRHEKSWSKRCILESTNNFPRATGLASSSSGSAAMALAASWAAGLDLSESELSVLARLGSGSAARSIPGGWTRMSAGSDPLGSDAFAHSIAPADHWDLSVFVVKISTLPKAVSSTEAMRTCVKSPFWEAYVEASQEMAKRVEVAVLRRDFPSFAKLCHESCLMLHALSLSAGICYFEPESIAILQRVLRQSTAIPVCCTLDAGANVVILCERMVRPFMLNDIMGMGLDYVETRVGGGAELIKC